MRARSAIRFVLGILVYGGLLFGTAGTLAWPAGWIFLVSLFGGVVGVGVWLKRTDPALLAERTKPLFQKGQPRWDRVVLIAFVPSWLAWFAVPGLDAVRFEWSTVPPWGQAVGAGLYVLGWAGLVWTLKVNTFLVPVVRVQEERAQRVIDTGPYAIVRHPMYAAVFLWMPGASLMLGSLWGTAVCAWPVGVLVLRTVLEDRHLQRDLPGYAEYAQRVRFRLVPGIW